MLAWKRAAFAIITNSNRPWRPLLLNNSIFLKPTDWMKNCDIFFCSFDSCLKPWTALKAVTSCGQYWQLLQAVDSYSSLHIYHMQSTALIAETSSVHPFDSFRKLLSALTAKAALISNSLHHRHIHRCLISILISKGQLIQFSTRSSVS